MSTFLIFAALLTTLALAFVMIPLIAARFSGNDAAKNPANTAGVEASTLNLAVLRDQLRELEIDLQQGMIDQTAYEAARHDLACRVTQDVGADASARTVDSLRAPSHGLAMGLSVGLILLVWCLYVSLGNLEAFNPPKPGVASKPHGGKVSPEQINTMITQLKDHLKANPDDIKGWTMLARTYAGLERFTEAKEAFQKLMQLQPNDPTTLADAADTTAMTQGQSLQGEPEKLIQRALEIDPKHIKSLILLGSVKYERMDYPGAVADWRRLKAALPPNSEMLATVDENIREAQSLILAKGTESADPANAAGSPVVATSAGAAATPAAAAATPAAASGKSVSGMVKLDPALQSQVSPDDTVFIFARAPEGGPRFPLAVVRKQVRDLPIRFTLDDTMSMVPEVKLSGFKEVQIMARISKVGNAIPSPGDLEGTAGMLALGTQDGNIIINKKRE
jgi:cytochrome c-type biogenesis protein CcmH